MPYVSNNQITSIVEVCIVFPMCKEFSTWVFLSFHGELPFSFWVLRAEMQQLMWMLMWTMQLFSLVAEDQKLTHVQYTVNFQLFEHDYERACYFKSSIFSFVETQAHLCWVSHKCPQLVMVSTITLLQAVCKRVLTRTFFQSVWNSGCNPVLGESETSLSGELHFSSWALCCWKCFICLLFTEALLLIWFWVQ